MFLRFYGENGPCVNPAYNCGPYIFRYFYLLENLAYVKSFNMCLDLEDCNQIFGALFSLMFKIVNDEHSGKVS